MLRHWYGDKGELLFCGLQFGPEDPHNTKGPGGDLPIGILGHNNKLAAQLGLKLVHQGLTHHDPVFVIRLEVTPLGYRLPDEGDLGLPHRVNPH